MKKVIFTTLFLLNWVVLFAQEKNITSYLTENATAIDLTNPKFQFDKDFYTNDLFFFGMIVGRCWNDLGQ